MSIIKVVGPASGHRCEEPPPAKDYGVGTIWQCDVCKKKRELRSDWREGGYVWVWLAY